MVVTEVYARINPVLADRWSVLADPGFGDHATVPHDHDLLQSRLHFQFGCLCGDRGRVAHITLYDLDGDRNALVAAQSATVVLGRSPPVISAAALLCLWAPAALEVGRPFYTRTRMGMNRYPSPSIFRASASIRSSRSAVVRLWR